MCVVTVLHGIVKQRNISCFWSHSASSLLCNKKQKKTLKWTNAWQQTTSVVCKPSWVWIVGKALVTAWKQDVLVSDKTYQRIPCDLSPMCCVISSCCLCCLYSNPNSRQWTVECTFQPTTNINTFLLLRDSLFLKPALEICRGEASRLTGISMQQLKRAVALTVR